MVEPKTYKPIPGWSKLSQQAKYGVAFGMLALAFGLNYLASPTSPQKPQRSAALEEALMVTDDTRCDWVAEAFKAEDPPKVRAIGAYITSLMINHEFETDGHLLETRDDEAMQRLHALPVAICTMKPETSLYEQVMNTYDRIWADEKKWQQRGKR